MRLITAALLTSWSLVSAGGGEHPTSEHDYIQLSNQTSRLRKTLSALRPRDVLDGQHVFRKVTNATEGLRTDARSLVERRLGITADIGALY